MLVQPYLFFDGRCEEALNFYRDQLGGEITDYLAILRSRARIIAIVKDELNSIKAQFGTPRRTGHPCC